MTMQYSPNTRMLMQVREPRLRRVIRTPEGRPGACRASLWCSADPVRRYKVKKVVLAYSGGLDTSVAVAWLKEQYGAEVVTLTVDLGGESLRTNVTERALASGASRAYVIDGRDRFIRQFVWPSLQANALYQGVYPLATALARPLIAQLLVEVARQLAKRAQ